MPLRFDPVRVFHSGRARRLLSLTVGALLVGALAPPGWAAAPADITKLTSASTSAVVNLEWVPSVTPGGQYVLIVRREGSAVTATPVNGQEYIAGDPVGDGGESVVVNFTNVSPWDDGDVAGGTVYYYKFFAYNATHEYAGGVAIVGRPPAGADVKWVYDSGVTALAPVGVAGAGAVTDYLVATGNDQLVHRMGETDGTRTDWTPPTMGSASQQRPTVGDPRTDDFPQGMKAYLSTQNGLLLRYDLTTSADPDGSQDVVALGCWLDGLGTLQAGPVVMVNAYEGNANEWDDVVIQSTRCDFADTNMVVMFDHRLLGYWSVYDGSSAGDDTDPGLGISNGAPMILYRDSGNNLVYATFREDSVNHISMVVLEVGYAGNPGEEAAVFVDPPFAVIRGIGDIDASPVVFRRGTHNEVLAGTRGGHLYLYQAEGQVDADGTGAGTEKTLIAQDDFPNVGQGDNGADDDDGPVKGLSVSSDISQDGTASKWAAWSTDTKVHAVKIDKSGLIDGSTYRSRAIGEPSIPLVLRGFSGDPNTYIAVGSSDGNGYSLNAGDGSLAIHKTFAIATGATTVGDPTFDYNDGVNYGLIFGATNGAIYWFDIKNGL